MNDLVDIIKLPTLYLSIYPNLSNEVQACEMKAVTRVNKFCLSLNNSFLTQIQHKQARKRYVLDSFQQIWVPIVFLLIVIIRRASCSQTMLLIFGLNSFHFCLSNSPQSASKMTYRQSQAPCILRLVFFEFRLDLQAIKIEQIHVPSFFQCESFSALLIIL